MSVAVVTGSAGLIGSEAVRHFAGLGLEIVGIDNDMRAKFFGPEASTAWNVLRLTSELGDAYHHYDVDIRDRDALSEIFKRYRSDVALVVHTAAQPSHDWAVRDPYTDFDINAGGTLNVLQHVRDHCPEAPVIHCSTNKVYGDRPNSLPYVELETRWELEPGHT
jgi:CDP-paratose 2-epimerase